MRNRGVARMVCNTRIKRGGCSQTSARLDIYETILLDYLEAFHIPEDYQQRLIDAQRQLNRAYADSELRKRQLTTMLERLMDLYKWGDIDREQYFTESREIEAEVKALTSPTDDSVVLEKLAHFLRDIPQAWREAGDEHRNKLARTLFDTVWIENQKVLGVTPRPELKPFFDLQYSELLKDVLQWRPRPVSGQAIPVG